MVTSNEKLMKHLPPEGKKTLVELLQPLNQFAKDYRGLADSLGFDKQFIDWLGSTNEPVVRLLTHIESIKITEVISHLEKMGRQDAAEDLRQFEGKFSFLVYLTVEMPLLEALLRRPQ